MESQDLCIVMFRDKSADNKRRVGSFPPYLLPFPRYKSGLAKGCRGPGREGGLKLALYHWVTAKRSPFLRRKPSATPAQYHQLSMTSINRMTYPKSITSFCFGGGISEMTEEIASKKT